MPASEPTIVVISPDTELRRPVEHILASRGYRPVGFASTEDYLCVAEDVAAFCIVVPMQGVQNSAALPGWQRLTGEGMPPVVFITGLRTASLRTGSTSLLSFFAEQVLAAVSGAKAVIQ